MKRFLIFAILILSACNETGPGTEVENYRTGSEGVSIELTRVSDTLYAGQKLNLVVDIYNKGAYSNPKGKIILSGYDKEYIHFISNVQDMVPIQGKSTYNSQGGADSIGFEEGSPITLPIGDLYKPTLAATACYYYETYATPTVCIIPDPTSPVVSEICTPGPVTMSNQGAPIAVTRVETATMSDYVNFIFTIKNVGKGRAIANSPDAFNNCPFNKDPEYDIIDYELVASNLLQPQCTPEKIKLFNGEGRLQCKFVTTDEDPVETQVGLKLKYHYKDTITKDLAIQGTPFNGNLPPDTPDPYQTTPGVTPEQVEYPVDTQCDCTDCVCLVYEKDGKEIEKICDPSLTFRVKDGSRFGVRANGMTKCGYYFAFLSDSPGNILDQSIEMKPCRDGPGGIFNRNEQRKMLVIYGENENNGKTTISRCLFNFEYP